MQKIIIAAMAENRTIGKNNKLPWHIPEELKLFKKETMGSPMIMGRKTFESLPGLLPGRRHIVLTRNPEFVGVGAECASSWDEALALCENTDTGKVYIIGGAEIFMTGLKHADHLRITFIHRNVDGDVFFPEYTSFFQEESRENFSGKNEDFTIVQYSRKQK